jgi:hypothetical protein
VLTAQGHANVSSGTVRNTAGKCRKSRRGLHEVAESRATPVAHPSRSNRLTCQLSQRCLQSSRGTCQDQDEVTARSLRIHPGLTGWALKNKTRSETVTTLLKYGLASWASSERPVRSAIS